MTGEPIRVFFLEPTALYVRSLRRMRSDSRHRCSVGRPFGYCTASADAGSIIAAEYPTSGNIKWPRDDKRWPERCAQCGEPFRADDAWLVDHDRVYRRFDTGDTCTLKTAPAGACWDATWFRDRPEYRGPDGRTLVVRLPDGGDWMIDSRAKNCTLPNDREHKCWIRHGRPEDGTLHVDKRGFTCAAGAGSIATKTWHGFLHDGYLRRC